jgi:hypothetical protein
MIQEPPNQWRDQLRKIVFEKTQELEKVEAEYKQKFPIHPPPRFA